MNKAILYTLIFAVVALFGFKQYEKGAARETMTIIAKGNQVHISGSNQSFQMKKLKTDEKPAVDSKYNTSAVLKLLNEYQNNGWHIKSSNLASTSDFIGEQSFETHTLYFLLEK
ncbi:hypothetical protein [Pontibacter ruber]|uniref:DUF4177 domain-containing protein n=1 Tax=Pontibacter ruber TaxID=1343895 RepID=A0ABW5CZH6_9BACT|nr:hypothetical protein [Pontibacter ruber]